MNYDVRLPLGMCPAYVHLSRREAYVGIACTRFSDKPRGKPGRAPDNGEEDHSRQAVFWYVCIACVNTSLPVRLVLQLSSEQRSGGSLDQLFCTVVKLKVRRADGSTKDVEILRQSGPFPQVLSLSLFCTSRLNLK